MRAIAGLVRAGQLPICINVALDAKKASGGVQKVASEQELGMQRGRVGVRHAKKQAVRPVSQKSLKK